MMKQLLGTIRADVSPEQIKAAVDGYLDSWRNNDAQARGALFADDAIFEDPVGTPPIVGKSALFEFWKRTDAVPTRFEPVLERLIVCGNEALVQFTLTITIEGVPPCTIRILENFRLDKQGKIAHLRAFWDESSVA
ncbi:nuclear transport factor 2 family protein [Herbaspirillum sp. GCM10030257]|uniref:nuclear transport factor 2 family protein n=1 Tax=Herbaspirillum sp. GCM10030257 TaxID=3273393 RepID=UPI00362390F2